MRGRRCVVDENRSSSCLVLTHMCLLSGAVIGLLVLQSLPLRRSTCDTHSQANTPQTAGVAPILTNPEPGSVSLSLFSVCVAPLSRCFLAPLPFHPTTTRECACVDASISSVDGEATDLAVRPPEGLPLAKHWWYKCKGQLAGAAC